MACPDPEAFERLCDNALPVEERARIADHAAGCADCRALLDALIDSAAASAPSTAQGVRSAPDPGFGLGHGTRIGRYVVERRIGQGGMGVVYAARDPELGRGVAIKLLRAGAPAARLRREAQALARLSHPNVVAVHDVGDHDGQTFIAMALVDGDNLRGWLGSPRTTAEILRVVVAAGRGIAAAHAAGMIHRDLKPDNVFVARDGAVLVGDFGLARDSESAELLAANPATVSATAAPDDLTATGTILGTPAYMAPEQAKGQATEASDQFSFCVTVWESLFGARPTAELVPREDRDVPARARSALRRGLSADPAARFPSMSALLDELAPQPRRWPWLVVGAAVVATLAIVGVAVLRPHDGATCDTARMLDGIWGPSQRAPTLLEPYAQHWLAARNDLCVARTELPAAVSDARLACLDQRRAALGAAVVTLASHPTGASARSVVDALPSIDDCLHATGSVPEAQRAVVARLDERLASLEAGYRADRGPALGLVRAVAAEAEGAHVDGPLVAALVLEGDMLRDAGLPDEAEPVLRRALAVAERASDDAGRVRASVGLIEILVRLQRLVDARHVLDQATAILARIGTSHDLELALVVARAAILSAEGDHRGAAELLRGYVAARERDHDLTDLTRGYELLGRELVTMGSPDAVEVFRKVATLVGQLEGGAAATAEALDAEAIAAQNAGQLERAIELDERALALVRSGPHSVDDETAMLDAMSISYNLAGAWVQMREVNETELRLVPDTADNRKARAEILENIGIAQFYSLGPAHAIEPLEQALALDREIGADDANAVIFLAAARLDARQPHEARTLLEAKLPAIIGAEPPRPWRRATAAYVLAQALWEDGDERDRGRARALAGDAERDFVAGIDQLSQLPSAVTSVRILKDRLVALRSWRERHP